MNCKHEPSDEGIEVEAINDWATDFVATCALCGAEIRTAVLHGDWRTEELDEDEE